MSSGTPIKKGRATTAAERRAERTAARAQRQQLRAMEARAAKTGTTFVDTHGMDAEFVEVGASGAATLRRGKVVARPAMLTRAQEYAYIRADMRRLIITAAGLLVLMFILLLIFG